MSFVFLCGYRFETLCFYSYETAIQVWESQINLVLALLLLAWFQAWFILVY